MGKQVRVSDAAYSKMLELSKEEKYGKKGLIGVLDMVLLGRFTTKEAGRPPKKKSKKS